MKGWRGVLKAARVALSYQLGHFRAKFFRYVLGFKATEQRDSNLRESMARLCGFTALMGLYYLYKVKDRPSSPLGRPIDGIWPDLLAYVSGGATLITAAFCICYVFAKAAYDNTFVLEPFRLIRDILFSSLGIITCFALLYNSWGIQNIASNDAVDSIDLAYFSIVVFTTLGFGDFVPCPDARLLAGLEALLGNFHLGMLAGAFYYALNYRK